MNSTYYKIYFIMDIYQIYRIKCKSMIVHDIFFNRKKIVTVT